MVENIVGRAATSSTTQPLVSGWSYRWNVRACNSAGCGSNSSSSFFTIANGVEDVPDTTLDAPGVLFGSAMAPGVTVTENTPQLRWSAVSGATFYDVDIFDTVSGDRIAGVGGHTSTSYTTPQLALGRSYRWNVRACNNSGCGSRSRDAFFFVSGSAIVPAISILLSRN